MSLIKVECQACGLSAEIENNIELDLETIFFMWSSHTDYSGSEVMALFCLSCGSINAVILDSGVDLKYILAYKLDGSDLAQWCVEKKVPAIARKKLKDFQYIK